MMFFNNNKKLYKDDVSTSEFMAKKKPHTQRKTHLLTLLNRLAIGGSAAVVFIGILANITNVLEFIAGGGLPVIITNISPNIGVHKEVKVVENNNGTIVMSEVSYLNNLHNAIELDEFIYDFHYNDYNNDGTSEMFAFVTTNEEKDLFDSRTKAGVYLGITGDIWFVNVHGSKKLDSKITCYPHSPFQIGHMIFFPYDVPRSKSFRINLWGVNKEGEPYQPNISGKLYGSSSWILIKEKNEMVVTCTSEDSYYDFALGHATGTSYNDYYFYWDGTNFKEYGGQSISVDELYSISGTNELLNTVFHELQLIGMNEIQIRDIYYRENGIVNVNIRCYDSDKGFWNFNTTLRCIDNKMEIVLDDVTEGVYNNGLHLFAIIPSIQTPPQKSFREMFKQTGNPH